MTPLNELESKIRQALPRLMELKQYEEIIIPKDYSQQHFSYTIINIIESNSYLDNKKTWEGIKIHDEMTQIVLAKNNAISYELERFAVKDCIYNGQSIYLSDVLEWLKGFNTDIHSINKYGVFHKISWEKCTYWDTSKPLLKDQPKEVIEYLNGLK